MNLLVSSLNENCNYVKAEKQNKSLCITGLTDSAKAYIALAICGGQNEEISSGLVVTKSIQSAKKMISDLAFFSNDYDICFMPSLPINYYDVSSESREIENERVGIINKVLSGKKMIVVTTIDSLVTNTLKKNLNSKTSNKIRNDSKIKLNEMIELFSNLGYERYDKVEGKGTFSVRGDIVDVFPVDSILPCRIEFLFDEIDSIRTFDLISQRSIDTLKEFNISAVNENILSDYEVENVINKLEQLIANGEVNSNVTQILDKDIEKLKNGDYKNIVDKYFKLFQNYEYTMLDFFVDNKFKIFLDEYKILKDRVDDLVYENYEIVNHLKNNGYILEDYINNYIPLENIISRTFKDNKFYALQRLEDLPIDNLYELKINTKEACFYRESFETLEKDILRYKNEILVISLASLARKNQVMGFLDNKNIKYTDINNISDIKLKSAGIYVLNSIISAGFSSEDLEFCIIAEPVSGTYKKSSKNKKKESIGKQIYSYEDLSVGDYVVHENHGIGRYLGIESIKVQDVIKDYIKIEYASSGMLYVPVEQLDLVKKYEAGEVEHVKLNALNGKAWESTKAKVNSYVKDIAKDLIKLYATRRREDGFSFLKDTPWQKEFEDSFPYELTDDQKRAIEEIKADMESPEIMDRLLCGDVGYGKTEVALRASFKAVMSGKQVAYLVPTTVLCLQQFNTFKERMEPFGVRVEMLCRLKTKKEQDKIVKDLKDGKVDVVIGTHRILSEDVHFKNLGFLVIDEEHRFGVTAKEKIKKLKTNIDVLSMSATPIPRTLNMSLLGIRKMSNLTEPPIERLPVHTYVMEYDKAVISDAIKKELLRDGQVFYLSNRVEDIEEVTLRVREISPKEARIAYAHGKMNPSELEDIMLKFINHEIDILVCTTILESGVDIKNANLIIVENADKLGLAQLYQIRGRVGRSNRLAYAYITYKRDKQISEISEKRLKAIKDFTEFGSGYKIALRDLELRGTGNLLGAMQHGHIVSVGYNMYLSLLDKALKEENGNNDSINNAEQTVEKEIKIDLNVSAYISNEYIPDLIQKLAMYQKISDIETNEEALDVIDELVDRYGEPPKEVENLIKVVEIRNMCRKIGINKVYIKGENLIFEPENLKYSLTNKSSNDILVYVQKILTSLQEMLEK